MKEVFRQLQGLRTEQKTIILTETPVFLSGAERRNVFIPIIYYCCKNMV